MFISDASSSAGSAVHSTAMSHSVSAPNAFIKSGSTAGSPPLVRFGDVQSSTSSYSLNKDEEVAKWSPYTESLFQGLVALRADKKATAMDLARLEKFRKIRQRLKNPIGADFILREFKAHELRKQALCAVQAYALFVENSPRSS